MCVSALVGIAKGSKLVLCTVSVWWRILQDALVARVDPTDLIRDRMSRFCAKKDVANTAWNKPARP